MTASTLRGLRTRKLRTLLTAVAVVLGVAMVTGTLVLGATAKRGFTGYFQERNSGSSAVITGQLAVKDGDRGTPPPPLPVRVVDEIAAVPGVALAEGRIEDQAQLIDRNGKVLGSDGPPKLAYSVLDGRLTGLDLSDGRWPHAGEVAIDATTAAQAGLGIGDEIDVATRKPTERYRISGLVRLGDIGTAGATFTVFDLATAQRLFDRPGEVDAIRVAAQPGVSDAEVVRRIEAAGLTTDVPLRVETAKANADRTMREEAAFVDYLRYFLLAFAGIAVFVGAFIIFNTFSITVQQRTRELAVLRSIGATRRQVLGSVLLEAGLLAVVASLVGVVAGIAIASGILALFQALDLKLPTVPLVLTTGTLLPGFVVGAVVTVLAGVVPAIRATRIAPTAAMREAGPSTRPPRKRSLVIGLGLLALSITAMGVGLIARPGGPDDRLLLVVLGALTLFMGTAVLASRLVSPLAVLLGWPMRRMGGAAGQLATENTRRDPGRTAVTAAALMIGVSLVAFISIFLAAVADSQSDEVDRRLPAELVVTSSMWLGAIDPGVGERIADVPGVASVAAVPSEISLVDGNRHVAYGVDPASFPRAYDFDWVHGDDALARNLGARDALMEDSIATADGIAVGDAFEVTSPAGDTATFTLRGTFTDESTLAGYVVRQDAFNALFPGVDPSTVLVSLQPGAGIDTTKAAVESATTSWQGLLVQSHADLRAQIQQDVASITALVDGMLALSILISLFGIVNTLVLSIMERTRELSMLRAVGASRRQVRRMVRYESVITTLIGTTLGLGLGTLLAFLCIRAIDGVSFALPVVHLAVVVGVAAVLGVLAAVFPARRASRLDPLAGLQYE